MQAAVNMEDLPAIDELIKHGAHQNLKTQLGYFLFYHPDVLEHCARKKYVTLADIDELQSHVPATWSSGYSATLSEAEFTAQKGRMLSALASARRLLRLPEPDESEIGIGIKKQRQK